MAMGVQRVLIVEPEQLLGAGLVRLLGGEPKLQVVGVSPAGEAGLLTEICQAQPDVVILDKASPLAASLKLPTLLGDYPQLKVILASAEDNVVGVYALRRVLVNHVADFIGIICGSWV
jgi:DNA-binding NarL/FixJ family response regulator